jgi:hypothetical protein
MSVIPAVSQTGNSSRTCRVQEITTRQTRKTRQENWRAFSNMLEVLGNAENQQTISKKLFCAINQDGSASIFGRLFFRRLMLWNSPFPYISGATDTLLGLFIILR